MTDRDFAVTLFAWTVIGVALFYLAWQVLRSAQGG